MNTAVLREAAATWARWTTLRPVVPVTNGTLLRPQAAAEDLVGLSAPMRAVRELIAITDDRTMLVLVMLVIFIIAGMFMETTPNIVILAPLLFPVAKTVGMDPIHFCVFMITSLGLGFITPPMGLNLFVMAGLTGQPIMAIARRAFPFVCTMVAISVVVGFVPQLSLWLLR